MKLRQFREKHGLTQEELGAVLGYSHSMVSRIESGSRPLDGLAWIRIARALGVPVRTIYSPKRDELVAAR